MKTIPKVFLDPPSHFRFDLSETEGQREAVAWVEIIQAAKNALHESKADLSTMKRLIRYKNFCEYLCYGIENMQISSCLDSPPPLDYRYCTKLGQIARKSGLKLNSLDG